MCTQACLPGRASFDDLLFRNCFKSGAFYGVGVRRVGSGLGKVEEMLRQKLSQEDFDLARQILDMPVSKIRVFIQEKVDEVEST